MAVIASPPVIVEPFAAAGLKNVIPKEAPATPGLASYDTGFPAINMQPTTDGGIPPSGKDFNGILFDVSAHAAWAQAGMGYVFAQEVADAGGYPVGAVLRSAADLQQYFYNTLLGNTNDPDAVPTGWLAFSPVVGSATDAQAAVLGAGQTNDFALTAGGGVGFLDITANVAGSALSGFANGKNGQMLTVTNVSANALTLKALTGSAAGNQLRLPDDLVLLQYGRQSFRKSVSLNVWVPV